MAIAVHQPTVSRAHSLIEQGKVDVSGHWDSPSEYEQADCLGTHDDETKSPGYPIIKDGKLSRKGVISAKQRAAGEPGAGAIESAADGILSAIDAKKTQKASLALLDGGELQRLSATNGIDLPSSVFGEPAYYAWKDVISPGDWLAPTTYGDGTTRIEDLKATPERIRHWAEAGNQMCSAGVEIPIVADHSEKSGDSRGYIKLFKVENGDLQCLCQLIGDSAKLEAARNRVSIGRSNYANDGKDGGKSWQDVITHVALTPRPVVSNQDTFRQAASAAKGTGMADKMLPCSETHMAKLHELVPGLAGMDDNAKIGHIVSHLCTMSAADDADAGDGMSKMSRTEIMVAAGKNRKAWREELAAVKTQLSGAQQQLSTANDQVQRLSAQVPASLPAEAVDALRSSASVLFDSAVEKASITPAVRDAVFTAMAGSNEKPNYQCLSKGACSEAPILAVAKALNQNPPRTGVDGKAITGTQQLSRATPGADGKIKLPFQLFRENQQNQIVRNR